MFYVCSIRRLPRGDPRVVRLCGSPSAAAAAVRFSRDWGGNAPPAERRDSFQTCKPENSSQAIEKAHLAAENGPPSGRRVPRAWCYRGGSPDDSRPEKSLQAFEKVHFTLGNGLRPQRGAVLGARLGAGGPQVAGKARFAPGNGARLSMGRIPEEELIRERPGIAGCPEKSLQAIEQARFAPGNGARRGNGAKARRPAADQTWSSQCRGRCKSRSSW